MTRLAAVTSLTIALFATASGALAQNAPPFFGGGVVANSPTISTVNSGAVFDAQATVSYDRKYVTIGAQAQDSQLIALRDFQVSSAIQQGFVGGVNPGGGAAGGGAGAGGAGGGMNAPIGDGNPPSPAQIQRAGIAARSVLNQRGMFLLANN